MSDLSNYSLDYLAGYIDGEGCFRWDGTQRIEVTNTYPHVLFAMRRMLGGKVRMMQNRGKPIWRWCVSGKDARHALFILSPSLREKAAQAVILRTMHLASAEQRVLLNVALKALKRIHHLPEKHKQ